MPFPHNKWVFNCKYSLMGRLFRYFAHLSKGSLVFLLLSCKFSLCILDTSSLSNNGFVKCFHQVVVCCYLHIICYKLAFALASFVERVQFLHKIIFASLPKSVVIILCVYFWAVSSVHLSIYIFSRITTPSSLL